ncbi:MAG: sigma-70 family RNA polymerase sigma factor [Chloroflexota bacterium]|nr:sigma-70 family RNA polymerase sigma factor [Chloroflexota bacterium]
MTAYEIEGWVAAKGEALPRAQLMDLMNHHEQALSNYLHVLLGDRDLAMDCAQDTFMRAYQNLNRGNPVTAAWLYKVARNRAMDEFRTRRRECRESEAIDRIPNVEVTEGTLSVRRVLARLCPNDREVLYLFAVDKFETAQIAAMLGVQPGAVRMRLVRARERFRMLYEGGA